MELIDVKSIVKMLKIDSEVIYKMIKTKEFPQPINFGKKKFRWDVVDIVKWVEEKKQQI